MAQSLRGNSLLLPVSLTLSFNSTLHRRKLRLCKRPRGWEEVELGFKSGLKETVEAASPDVLCKQCQWTELVLGCRGVLRLPENVCAGGEIPFWAWKVLP